MGIQHFLYFNLKTLTLLVFQGIFSDFFDPFPKKLLCTVLFPVSAVKKTVISRCYLPLSLPVSVSGSTGFPF